MFQVNFCFLSVLFTIMTTLFSNSCSSTVQGVLPIVYIDRVKMNCVCIPQRIRSPLSFCYSQGGCISPSCFQSFEVMRVYSFLSVLQGLFAQSYLFGLYMREENARFLLFMDFLECFLWNRRLLWIHCILKQYIKSTQEYSIELFDSLK